MGAWMWLAPLLHRAQKSSRTPALVLQTRSLISVSSAPGSIFFAVCIRKDPMMTPVRRYLPALATLLLAFLVLSFLPPVALGQATCTAPKNAIEAENIKVGTKTVVPTDIQLVEEGLAKIWRMNPSAVGSE